MIVAAVANASGLYTRKSDLNYEIEKAMDEAVLQAIAEGVSIEDSEEILRRKLEARDRVKASN